MNKAKMNFAGLTTIKEILTVAGLDFKVNANHPIKCNGIVSSDLKGITSNQGHFFGVCKKNYKVIQAHESLEISELLLSNGFKVNDCYLHTDKIVLKLSEIEKHKVSNIGDIYDTNIFMTSDFSGKQSNKYSFFLVRLACTNGMKANKKESEYSLKHFSNYKDKFSEVQKIIMNLKAFKDNLDKNFNRMFDIKMQKNDIETYLNTLLNIDIEAEKQSTRLINEKNEILSIVTHKADLKKFDNNLYKVFQAVNDYYSNNKNYKNASIDNNIKETNLVFSNILENNYNLAMEFANNN